MATVEVRDGRLVAVRNGGPELAREAEVLRTVAGPGVPEVVEQEEGRLVTTLAPPLPRTAVPRVAAALAAVLARAHAVGITHGPIRDEHLLGSVGSLLLAGWESAGSGDPADDVAEYGRLLERHAGGDVRLMAVAARALAPDPPTMAALCAALQARPAPGRRPVPVSLLAGVAVTLALVAAGLLTRGGPPTEPPAAASIESKRPAAPPPSTTTSLGPVAHVTGNVVEREGERWRVGRPGDVVVVGDWDCDGEATPAVLRPATGEVWLFARWSTAAAPEAGRVAATVDGATAVRVRHADACDRLVVASADGQSTTVG